MENETQNAPEIRIYRVFDCNMPRLEERIAKLNRRATKLGVSLVVVAKISKDLFREVLRKPQFELGRCRLVAADYALKANEEFTGGICSRNNLTINGSTPKLAGWEFLGKIEVVRDEEGTVVGNLLRLVPGAVAPATYRDVKPWCDHCNVNRLWAETFIIKHDDGTHKQVGRRCLADFLGGVDPNQIASSAEWLMSIGDAMGEAEDGDLGGEGYVPSTYDIESLLQHTACHIRMDGWLSGSKAEDLGLSSTRNSVMSDLNSRTDEQRRQWEKYVITEADEKMAEDTVNWLDSLPLEEENEYRYSLALLGLAGAVNVKQTGLLCSAIPTMLRDKEQELKRRLLADAHRQSQYLGAEKQRMVFPNLTVELIRYIEGNFGTSTLYTFVDLNGNVIQWFASNNLCINGTDTAVGQQVSLKATVKNHKEYQGIKSTYINRAVVV